MAERGAIAENFAAVRARIAAAAQRAGRDGAAVTLCAVSKTHPPEAIRAAYAAGQRLFGESYAQELRDKAAALADLPELTWHFIGPLQRNKVKYVVGTAALIHSLDSTRLLEEVAHRAATHRLVMPCLVEVNIAGEETKSGIAADELPELLDAFVAHASVRCVGLMTMPPWSDEPEAARPFFRRLRELRDRETARPRAGVELRHLSMGMTHDFEVAVEEGATIVRVGTALFGGRA